MVADPLIVLSGLALFVVLGGSAVAATGLIHAGDIAPGRGHQQGDQERRGRTQGSEHDTRALLAGGPG